MWKFIVSWCIIATTYPTKKCGDVQFEQQERQAAVRMYNRITNFAKQDTSIVDIKFDSAFIDTVEIKTVILK